MHDAAPQLNARERLDRMPVTMLHCFAIGLCAFGFTFDLLEIALGSVLSAVFSTPKNAAAPLQLSLLLASVYVGAVFGAPLLGRLADRHGRRIALMGTLALLAATSLAGAFSNGLTELTVWRCLAGVALGGYPPLMIAYLTDLLPAKRRGMLVLVAVAIATLGPAAGIFLVRALAVSQPFGLEGWRWGFIAGGAGAAIVAALFRSLPESPCWLQDRGRAAEAAAACLRFERSSHVLAAMPPDAVAAQADAVAPQTRNPWPLLATLFFLSPWSTVAFPLLTGAILAQKGFKLSDTLLYVGVSTVGPFVGTLLAALYVDAVGRRTALALCAVAMLVSGLVFVSSDSPFWLVCSSFSFTLFGALFVTVLNLYGAELFPTAERATAIAGAWAMNRVGAAIAPLVLLPLLGGRSAFALFAVIAAMLVAGIALLAAAPQGRQRRSVR